MDLEQLRQELIALTLIRRQGIENVLRKAAREELTKKELELQRRIPAFLLIWDRVNNAYSVIPCIGTIEDGLRSSSDLEAALNSVEVNGLRRIAKALGLRIDGTKRTRED